eukprot:759439-Hanusia_phi.AAC.8
MASDPLKLEFATSSSSPVRSTTALPPKASSDIHSDPSLWQGANWTNFCWHSAAVEETEFNNLLPEGAGVVHSSAELVVEDELLATDEDEELNTPAVEEELLSACGPGVELPSASDSWLCVELL